MSFCSMFFDLCVCEYVLIAALCSQEVSNRTTPTDSKYVSKAVSSWLFDFCFLFFFSYLPRTVELIDFYSSYAKQKLVGLHPNVMVQRSPSHFQTGTFYWAHVRLHSPTKCHWCCIEQLTLCSPLLSFSMRRCVSLIRQLLSWVDWICVLGGELVGLTESFIVDFLIGPRWDTPQHVMTDDTADTDRPKIWPGMYIQCHALYGMGNPEYSSKARTTATLVCLISLTSTNLKKTCTIAPKCQGCLGMVVLFYALGQLCFAQLYLIRMIQAWCIHANHWTACSWSSTPFRSAVSPSSNKHTCDLLTSVPKMELPTENKGSYWFTSLLKWIFTDNLWRLIAFYKI